MAVIKEPVLRVRSHLGDILERVRDALRDDAGGQPDQY
eukprot:CAMPEP_0177413122 /NCGR_PEP_ID=MMETSP0368-20130122/66344_1 /TAXON_ID=447022 ORGANISM="Scrippsiella hangoei-like, Strain SHHI-4" /NCGR_SAMPLE_ID=MMETSP0368 /ASSEMBLY_ACC=CAM_ASM_000363 /LENGTH=37 /DNA_ID= /DNA_START= /DNA_END= /DNA_ORIENTATION=